MSILLYVEIIGLVEAIHGKGFVDQNVVGLI